MEEVGTLKSDVLELSGAVEREREVAILSTNEAKQEAEAAKQLRYFVGFSLISSALKMLPLSCPHVVLGCPFINVWSKLDFLEPLSHLRWKHSLWHVRVGERVCIPLFTVPPLGKEICNMILVK